MNKSKSLLSKSERPLAFKKKPASTRSNRGEPSDSKKNPQTMEELLAGYSWTGFKKGDQVTGTISSISGKEVLIDFGGKMEGVVGEKEWEQVKDYVATLKVGQKISAIVITGESERGQMVVSIRKTGSKYRWQKAEELLKSGEGITVKGVEINKGGLIVEFEGIRGFVPGSQLSAEHQGDMAKMLNRVITVKVIEVDDKQNRLIFSEKAVTGAAELTQKLKDLKSKIKIGKKYSGKISAIMPYGIFVNLENDADGLVHISEISWQKVENLGDLFKVGEEVEVLVLGINESDGKLNLSMKQLQTDPWLSMSKKYSAEQQVKGEVTRVSSYGIFVRLEEGIEGLIHISKVPAGQEYEVGQQVSCIVESIDSIAHRISLIPVLKAKPIGYK